MSDVTAELARDANDKAMEIARLKAENDKLRESVNRLMTQRDERLARAESENEKLREQIHWLKKGDILHVLTDQEYIDQCERERLMQASIDALDKENAKLRELVSWMYDRMDESCAVQYPYAPAPISYDRLMQAWARAHELGVEVDG